MEVVVLTEKAQEQAKKLKNSQAPTKDGFRIAVVGGGCAGLQQRLTWNDIREDDFVHEYPNGLVVMVDQKSAILLQGSILEFHEGLDQSGFELSNPNARNSCGCNRSFSV